MQLHPKTASTQFRQAAQEIRFRQQPVELGRAFVPGTRLEFRLDKAK